MAIFTPDFAAFFKELAKNNEREWFHAQKKRYQQSVKAPFEELVEQLIEQIRTQDPSLQISAKDAILRINRDIRFSADKSPYNTYVTAFISQGGRKDKSIPGFFIRLSPEMLGIMVGCYGPDKDQLERIRTAIMAQAGKWKKIVEAATFKERFGEVRGEQHKRVPAPFKEHLDDLPVLANKQFYALTELPPQKITGERLVEELMVYWQAARPFNAFLLSAIKK